MEDNTTSVFYGHVDTYRRTASLWNNAVIPIHSLGHWIRAGFAGKRRKITLLTPSGVEYWGYEFDGTTSGTIVKFKKRII